MQSKVCGLTSTEQVNTSILYGANFCGFILNYKKSHRFIDYQTAEHLTKINKKNTSYVGVLVEPSIEELKVFSNLNLDYFQIYGNYSAKEIKDIKDNYKKKIIISLQIKKKQDTFYVGVLVNPSEEEFKKFSNLNLDYFQIYGNYSEEQLKVIKNIYKKKIIISLQIKQKQDILKYKIYEKTADIILFDSSGLHQTLGWNYNWTKQVPSFITKMIAGNVNIDMLENLKEITDIVDVSGALETDKVKDIVKIKTFLEKIKKIND